MLKRCGQYKSQEMVLLITGCIKPEANQKFLVLVNYEERLKQYVESIKYYIKESVFHNIVFCENSGFEYEEIDSIIEMARKYYKNIEWISFNGNKEKIIECGKGYGEGEIIKYALEHSDLMKSSHAFAKVTGRLVIKNINQLMKNVQVNRNYFNRDIYRGHGIDTRFYICEIKFYKNFLENAYEMTYIGTEKVVALEDVFYNVLKKSTYRSLIRYPIFVGKSGGNGRDYSLVPNWKIAIYSLFCMLNMFNQCYPFVLALKKLRLILLNLDDVKWERK